MAVGSIDQASPVTFGDVSGRAAAAVASPRQARRVDLSRLGAATARRPDGLVVTAADRRRPARPAADGRPVSGAAADAAAADAVDAVDAAADAAVDAAADAVDAADAADAVDSVYSSCPPLRPARRSVGPACQPGLGWLYTM